MTERYHFGFAPDTVYANVVSLVSEYRRKDGSVVLDLGAGYGAIAEAVDDLGLTYIGVDGIQGGLDDIAKRGFQTALVDLESPDLLGRLRAVLDGRPLAAITLIDTLEHLVHGERVLEKLNTFSLEAGCAPLVISVPNVTHFDVGLKLLMGRWDITEVGILDDTHVAFFSAQRLTDVTRTAGWTPVASQDFELFESDQHFPPDLVSLTRHTPVNDLLRDLSTRSSSHANVNQFVRVFAPLALAPEVVPGRESEASTVLLSVLLRTQGRRRTTLQETLLSLAAQTCDDFEVLLLCHDVSPLDLGHIRFLVDSFGSEFSNRIRVVSVIGGGRSRPLNVGLQEARGSYVSILDDDDVALGHWVETFKTLSQQRPGHVLRSIVAEQHVESVRWGTEFGHIPVDRPRTPYPATFDLIEHLLENRTPPSGYAIPRSCFRDFRIIFDETLPVLEDWDVLLQSVLLCGVVDSSTVTSLYRRWHVGESSTTAHSQSEWANAHATVVNKVNAHPIVLQAGAMETLRKLGGTQRELEAERTTWTVEGGRLNSEIMALQSALEAAHAEVIALRSSTSWKISSPLRRLSRKAQSLLDRPR